MECPWLNHAAYSVFIYTHTHTHTHTHIYILMIYVTISCPLITYQYIVFDNKYEAAEIINKINQVILLSKSMAFTC
jgi:hypothetical protein